MPFIKHYKWHPWDGDTTVKTKKWEYCLSLLSARFLHLVTNHWDVLISLCITILNQPITQAAARLWENLMDSAGPQNLAPVDCGPVDGFDPQKRSAPKLTIFSPSSLSLIPHQSFSVKLVWIFQTNGLFFLKAQVDFICCLQVSSFYPRTRTRSDLLGRHHCDERIETGRLSRFDDFILPLGPYSRIQMLRCLSFRNIEIRNV